jgi:hypothetical protein
VGFGLGSKLVGWKGWWGVAGGVEGTQYSWNFSSVMVSSFLTRMLMRIGMFAVVQGLRIGVMLI